MIKITPSAQAHFLKLLKPGQSIVVGTKRSGCSGLRYELDVVDEFDTTAYQAITADFPLLVESKSVPYLKGLVIDLEQEGLQSRIVYNNPNEAGKCGCGESFSV